MLGNILSRRAVQHRQNITKPRMFGAFLYLIICFAAYHPSHGIPSFLMDSHYSQYILIHSYRSQLTELETSGFCR